MEAGEQSWTGDRTAQCLLRLARDSEIDGSLIAQPAEPPDADPHVRWCGRGGVVRLPPISILDPVAYFPQVRHNRVTQSGEKGAVAYDPENRDASPGCGTRRAGQK